MTTPIQSNQEQSRILSIDFFRGFTMFMLVTGITGLFSILVRQGHAGGIIEAINNQLDHAEWNGLHAWDLIQPFFMFIVGASIPFSLRKRLERGDSWNKCFYHALSRSFWLLFFGFMIGAGSKKWDLTNVLAQLSFTYLIAFLLTQKDIKWQLIVSFALIIFNDLIYQFWSVDGFNQPYTADHNFGSWVDMTIAGSMNSDHWVAFNAIPTTAHTIWGAVVGRLLMKDWTHNKKILYMLIPGIAAIIIGYCMNPFIPIIKRLCTSSFMIVTGGYCLVAMALSYWLIDVKKFTKFSTFFAIVGMNSIFIYLFNNLGGRKMLTRIIDPYTSRLFSWTGPIAVNMITTAIVVGMVWYICYFMYKRKIFIRL